MATFSFLSRSEEMVTPGSPADICYPSTCLCVPKFLVRRCLVEKISSLVAHCDGPLCPLAAINVHCSQMGAPTWGENPKRR